MNRCILPLSTGLGHWIGQGTPDLEMKMTPRIRVKVFSNICSKSKRVYSSSACLSAKCGVSGFPSRSFKCLAQILAAVWRSKMMLAACIVYQGRHGQFGGVRRSFKEVEFSFYELFYAIPQNGSSPC